MEFASKQRPAPQPLAEDTRATTQPAHHLTEQPQRPGWPHLALAVQRAAENRTTTFQARMAAAQPALEPAPNQTGLPDRLKAGVEALSGLSLDHVRVHRNSAAPAKLNAHAFAQGTDIHLAPGQEQHLPHEAWHVVQQAQGRVKPTGQLKSRVPINDDVALEREADIMGQKAMQRVVAPGTPVEMAPKVQKALTAWPIQRVITGNPRYDLHMPAPLSGPARLRVQAAAAALAAVIHNDPNIQINQIILSIEAEGGNDRHGAPSTIAGDNPAETTVVPHLAGDPDIEITLQRPFAEAATVGELLGMLAHEVGVHSIPNVRNVGDRNQLAWPHVDTPYKNQLNDTPSGGYEFNAWPLPAHGGNLAYRDGQRQHDHVVAGQIVNTPLLPGAAAATRGEIYLQTVLDLGDHIWANAALSLDEKTTRVTELIHLYLVDIARIVATDDGRLPVVDNKLAVDDMYGHVFTTVVLPHRLGHPWIPASRPKANVVTLGLSLAEFVYRVKWEKFWRG